MLQGIERYHASDVTIALYRAGRAWGDPAFGALLLPTPPPIRHEPRLDHVQRALRLQAARKVPR